MRPSRPTGGPATGNPGPRGKSALQRYLGLQYLDPRSLEPPLEVLDKITANESAFVLKRMAVHKDDPDPLCTAIACDTLDKSTQAMEALSGMAGLVKDELLRAIYADYRADDVPAEPEQRNAAHYARFTPRFRRCQELETENAELRARVAELEERNRNPASKSLRLFLTLDETTQLHLLRRMLLDSGINVATLLQRLRADQRQRLVVEQLALLAGAEPDAALAARAAAVVLGDGSGGDGLCARLLEPALAAVPADARRAFSGDLADIERALCAGDGALQRAMLDDAAARWDADARRHVLRRLLAQERGYLATHAGDLLAPAELLQLLVEAPVPDVDAALAADGALKERFRALAADVGLTAAAVAVERERKQSQWAITTQQMLSERSGRAVEQQLLGMEPEQRNAALSLVLGQLSSAGGLGEAVGALELDVRLALLAALLRSDGSPGVIDDLVDVAPELLSGLTEKSRAHVVERLLAADSGASLAPLAHEVAGGMAPRDVVKVVAHLLASDGRAGVVCDLSRYAAQMASGMSIEDARVVLTALASGVIAEDGRKGCQELAVMLLESDGREEVVMDLSSCALAVSGGMNLVQRREVLQTLLWNAWQYDLAHLRTQLSRLELYQTVSAGCQTDVTLQETTTVGVTYQGLEELFNDHEAAEEVLGVAALTQLAAQLFEARLTAEGAAAEMPMREFAVDFLTMQCGLRSRTLARVAALVRGVMEAADEHPRARVLARMLGITVARVPSSVEHLDPRSVAFFMKLLALLVPNPQFTAAWMGDSSSAHLIATKDVLEAAETAFARSHEQPPFVNFVRHVHQHSAAEAGQFPRIDLDEALEAAFDLAVHEARLHRGHETDEAARRLQASVRGHLGRMRAKIVRQANAQRMVDVHLLAVFEKHDVNEDNILPFGRFRAAVADVLGSADDVSDSDAVLLFHEAGTLSADMRTGRAAGAQWGGSGDSGEPASITSVAVQAAAARARAAHSDDEAQADAILPGAFVEVMREFKDTRAKGEALRRRSARRRTIFRAYD